MQNPDMKQEKKEASWKIHPGISSNEAVSIESTLLPGYFLYSKIPSKVDTDKGVKLTARYEVSLEKVGHEEPGMSRMTFRIEKPISGDTDGASFKVIGNEELPYNTWFLRERGGKLYVEENDGGSAFASAASFNMTQPLFPTCPSPNGKMCNNKGTCVDITEGEGKCKCKPSHKGDTCEKSVIDIVDIKSSARFDYDGATGPSTWSTIDKNWKVCADGKRQSPITFKQSYKVMPLQSNEYLSASYSSAPYKINRKGKDLRLELLPAAGGPSQYVNAAGFIYDFSHIEIHAPGEHSFHKSVNDKCEEGQDYCTYDAEVHFVHILAKPQITRERRVELGESLGLESQDTKEAAAAENKKGGDAASKELFEGKTVAALEKKSEEDMLAMAKKAKQAEDLADKYQEPIGSAEVMIMAVPYKLGNWPSKLFSKILAYLPGRDAMQVAKGEIDIGNHLPHNPTYYRYKGSLTHPPCTEEVLWYVFTEPQELSADQLQAIFKANGKNARPMQPYNDRRIASAFGEEALKSARDEL